MSRRLLAEYPEQVDGFDRFGMVYEARGDRRQAAEYYRKAADFAKSNPGFDKKGIERFLSESERMESDQLNDKCKIAVLSQPYYIENSHIGRI